MADRSETGITNIGTSTPRTEETEIDLSEDLEKSYHSREAIAKLEREFYKLKSENTKEFSFLAVGKTGVGKSTLLNALTGTQEFTVGKKRGEIGTKIISSHQFERNGVLITAWDSPGFQDCSGNEELYKEELKNHCSNVDLVLFCISLKDTRADLGHDASALKQVTEALSPEVWKKAVVILTFANNLVRRLKTQNGAKSLNSPELNVPFEEKVQLWRQKVQTALKSLEGPSKVDEAVIEAIPVVPAGRVTENPKMRHLPGRQFWLSKLWLEVYKILNTNEKAQLALHKANEDRFIQVKDADKSSPTSIVLSADSILLIAGGAAGVAGAAVGGTAGGLIGALALGIPTFGIGAAVGLALGIVVGGAMGAGVGAATADLVKQLRAKQKAQDSNDTDVATAEKLINEIETI